MDRLYKIDNLKEGYRAGLLQIETYNLIPTVLMESVHIGPTATTTDSSVEKYFMACGEGI